mgnify:CR=1 FL=1
MENKYAFCVEELSNMGIGFETDEEMKRFSETVRNSLELRVGVAFDNILNSQEFNSLETVIDNSEPEDKAYEREFSAFSGIDNTMKKIMITKLF